MFMAEKNIGGINLVPVNLNQGEHFATTFRAKSPLAKVPALELDDGRVLTETRAICTYLEGLYPENNLMGVDFEERAFIEMADRRVEWTLLLGIANGVRHTHPGLAPLESPQFADFGQSQTQKVKDNAKVFDQLLQTQAWMAGPRFTIADITQGIHDKLVRRHPHVFANVNAESTDEVLSNWEAIKRAEKGRTSIFDGIPNSLPSLSYAYKAQRKAASLGFDWPDVHGALPKIAEETDELMQAHAAGDKEAAADELGDLLFSVVNVARHLKIDPEVALRAAVAKFRHRFEGVEQLAAERSIELSSAGLETLDQLWDEVKERDITK